MDHELAQVDVCVTNKFENFNRGLRGSLEALAVACYGTDNQFVL